MVICSSSPLRDEEPQVELSNYSGYNVYIK